jgi:hypothetical protein
MCVHCLLRSAWRADADAGCGGGRRCWYSLRNARLSLCHSFRKSSSTRCRCTAFASAATPHSKHVPQTYAFIRHTAGGPARGNLRTHPREALRRATALSAPAPRLAALRRSLTPLLRQSHPSAHVRALPNHSARVRRCGRPPLLLRRATQRMRYDCSPRAEPRCPSNSYSILRPSVTDNHSATSRAVCAIVGAWLRDGPIWVGVCKQKAGTHEMSRSRGFLALGLQLSLPVMTSSLVATCGGAGRERSIRNVSHGRPDTLS